MANLLLLGEYGRTVEILITLFITRPRNEAALLSNELRSSLLLRGPTCCSCVRAPLGESLSPPLLSPQLPFPKEKKRRTRSGEEGRRHYRKADRNTTFTHAICSLIGRDMNSLCCGRNLFETKRHGDCNKLTVVSCARPAQHYVGTTMDRIIIEKATW